MMENNNDDDERAILGAMLSNEDTDGYSIGIIGRHLSTKDLLIPAHCSVFETILRLDAQGLTTDANTVIHALREKGQLECAGGAEYIASLPCDISDDTRDRHIEKIKNRSVQRGLLTIAEQIHNDVLQAIQNDTINYREILEKIHLSLFDLAPRGFSYNKFNDVLSRAIDNIDALYKSEKVPGIPSGFPHLDKMITGFQPSDYIVISGASSVGKTSLVLSMIAHICFDKNIPAAIFSLGMPDIALANRMFALKAEVDNERIKTGRLCSDDLWRIIDTVHSVCEAPIYIDDKPNRSLLDIHTEAAHLKRFRKIQIIFVDYLNLIKSENTRMQLSEELVRASKFFKGLARELNIPVVVLFSSTPGIIGNSAMNGIKQDADMVIFLEREKDATKATLYLEKNRNGKTGEVKIDFLPQYMEFRESEEQAANNDDPLADYHAFSTEEG